MKLFAPVVVAVFAFFSVQVDANGVCYDPDHTSGKSASSVEADMKTIAGAGFGSVRTYISKFGNTEMGPIITGAGLTAVLGVPYPQGDYQEQMEAAIKAANSGGVYAIMVGNENLAGASSVPADMISVIKQIKSRVSCKVGTVQRNTEIINYQSISGWSDLVGAVDLLGANVHPFFNPGTTADGAIDVVDKQWKTMMSHFGDKLLLTETGWPSSGSVSGNTGSLPGGQTFYSAYQQWSSALGEKFYFQFFDTPGKSELFEQTFGLYTGDSQSKFGMSQQQSTPSTPASQQQQNPAPASAPALAPVPAQAPQPITSAPTPAPTPSPTPEPTTATPQQTTATPESTTATPVSPPTLAPETYQNSGSSATNSTSSASGPDKLIQQGSTSFSGSNDDVKVSSSSKDSSTEQNYKADSSSEQTTNTKETIQSTGTTNSIGKSSEQQTPSEDKDNTQNANTQSEGGSTNGVVGLAVAGGACAMLVAFGFIYQTRKRAQELEDGDKDGRFSLVTPAENICAL